jgi:hypothetical protein
MSESNKESMFIEVPTKYGAAKLLWDRVKMSVVIPSGEKSCTMHYDGVPVEITVSATDLAKLLENEPEVWNQNVHKNWIGEHYDGIAVRTFMLYNSDKNIRYEYGTREYETLMLVTAVQYPRLTTSAKEVKFETQVDLEVTIDGKFAGNVTQLFSTTFRDIAMTGKITDEKLLKVIRDKLIGNGFNFRDPDHNPTVGYYGGDGERTAKNWVVQGRAYFIARSGTKWNESEAPHAFFPVHMLEGTDDEILQTEYATRMKRLHQDFDMRLVKERMALEHKYKVRLQKIKDAAAFKRAQLQAEATYFGLTDAARITANATIRAAKIMR